MSDEMRGTHAASEGEATRGTTTLVPGIELGEEIGHGGFATVHLGHQISVDRRVAVKIDHRRFSDPRNRRRFLREVTAVGRISGHPHVVSLIDSGETTDGRPYLVMELCPNGSLADLLKRTGPLPAAEARTLGLAVTGALAAAHEAQILHRDIKPANVLIDAWGTPRLADFGLAALPVDGQELSVTMEALTPVYAAPEAFRNAPPSTRSDVWSMGATLHALISPFTSPRRSADGSPASIEQILHNLATPLPAPDAPGTAELMQVIEKATAYDPAERYADGKELYQALAALDLPPADDASVVSAGPEATVFVPNLFSGSGEHSDTTATPASKRRGGPLAVGALVLGLVAGGGGVWALKGNDKAEPSAGATDAPAPGTTPGAQPTTNPFTPDSPAASGTPEPQTPTGGPTAATNKFPAHLVGTCWGGLVRMNDIVTGTTTTCTEDHAYETFAVGQLAESTTTPYLSDVTNDPNFQKVCTTDAVKAYLGKKNLANYTYEVIPPRELTFAQGDRNFSCLVTMKEGDFRHKPDPE